MSFWNYYLIRLTNWLGERARRKRAREPKAVTDFIGDIAHFCDPAKPPHRRALLSLMPDAWSAALAEAPEIRAFNLSGFTYEVVKALNRRGYAVDIVNSSLPGFIPEKDYDFYLGHGVQVRSILDHLPPKTFVMHYVAGAFWETFNRMSNERYDHFAQRTGVPRPKDFVRSYHGREAEEEYLARRADASFVSGPRCVATYAGVSRNMSLLYYGSYAEKDLLVEDRDFEAGRKNFVYVAGTGGNVQKGMDLLLETFARLPHLHLYIYCKVEEEILRAYRKTLALPNIHYVYHLSRGRLRRRMAKLLRKINFSISAPIDTGIGTAFIGSMGIGLIPVGYVDVESDPQSNVVIDTYTIEALVKNVQEASEKSAEWCREASRRTLEKFAQLHDPPQFGVNFDAYLGRLGL